jgi:dTDP-4-dehydrorhamnose 3,5-epimerase
MKRIDLTLPGVCLIEPVVHGDDRGFFFECYHQARFAELGITDSFVQDNHARSMRGILRGLHYQIKQIQAKLCRVIQGEVLDVVVDVRRGSPDFGKYDSAILSAENKRQIFVPRGFAHGYLVLSETAEFVYKCSDFYQPDYERGLIWNDNQVAVPWGIKDPLLSLKDRALPHLSEIPLADLPEYGGP